MGFGVWGLGFRVWGLGFGVWGLGFGVWGLGFGVWGLGFGVWGLGFGVWGVLLPPCKEGLGSIGAGVLCRLSSMSSYAEIAPHPSPKNHPEQPSRTTQHTPDPPSLPPKNA